MFYLDPPIRLANHIVPVGIPDGCDSSHQISDHVTGDYSLGHIPLPSSPSTSQVLVEDVILLSASDMIQMSTAGSSTLINTFVCGKHEDGCHICLNLELDQAPLTSEQLEVTVDIDNLVFTHHWQVYLGPILEEKALIPKNNHVCVNILIPQSVEDAMDIGGHTEWLTMSLPLCEIPHTTFGTLSNASGSMNIYICFPRMIHRDEMMHRHANHIPKEVLDFFWEHVLLPAISECADVGSAPYVSLTLGEVWFKAQKGTKKRPGGPKAVPFSMDVLNKINYTMKEIIQGDPSHHANYGFFFFFIDCKGIKLWAKALLFQEDSSPIHALLNGIPVLDWPYMLLVDLGIGIHPKWDENLVGLWRPVCLEASFGAGSDFMQECMEAINMHSGEAKQRSYGVRDEYRMGGMAMEKIMDDLAHRMEDAWLMDPEKRPEPMSLEDAVKCWTLNTTFKTILACTFKPCDTEVPGSMGQVRSEYHGLMKDRTVLEQLEVTNHLAKIFSLLQTLPDTTKGSAKTPGMTWRVEDERVVPVTNQKFHKIKGISKEGEQCPARRKISQAVKSWNRVHMDLMEHAGYGELMSSKALLLEQPRLEQARN
ncbi:hypothetical protein PISMIDRAFT_25214 [Pisolithus microcarpus 441]|uniref:Uncharacterized protein n=1 Tax=Pisolithus microcarpus 441 TaxID=765257 RepID=A0A0C9YGV3_9AGAM|nr:hypothetical protein BKA83DRAFT_25214 [Pisolithus microcarpus]KIK15861.1 hypothetical protein PISMIDRAFT_25214 [Pisolithus microcarpus 441]